MKRLLCLLVVLLFAVPFAAGQKDRPGTKDHPLFNRMPGFFILDLRETEFDSVEFSVQQGPKVVKQAIEGHTYRFNYAPGKDITRPSALQVVRNYQEAAKAIGGKTVWDSAANGGAVRDTTIQIVKGDKETWTWVKAYPSGYYVTIVEKQAMKQDVIADAATFANDLRNTGKVAIYGIYFDTGKSELKPESGPALTEIGKLLKLDPALKVFIVGHTDMVGDAAMNLKLSQARAQSVVAELSIKYGIPSARLTPFGAGPYAPVASNDDEDGRAKNRRVELVKR